MKKKPVIVRCPEFTLPKRYRRQRAKRMAAIGVGTTLLTKRQVQRLPSKDSKHAIRQEKRLMKRYARKQGMSVAELMRSAP